MNVEAMIFAWLYTGIIVGVFSLAVVVWTIWFDLKNKDK